MPKRKISEIVTSAVRRSFAAALPQINLDMNNNGYKILDAIKRMAADDNKGLRMTTTIVDVNNDPRGSIVGFGTEKVCGDDAKAQIMGLPGKYMACAFFIDREELNKYL